MVMTSSWTKFEQASNFSTLKELRCWNIFNYNTYFVLEYFRNSTKMRYFEWNCLNENPKFRSKIADSENVYMEEFNGGNNLPQFKRFPLNTDSTIDRFYCIKIIIYLVSVMKMFRYKMIFDLFDVFSTFSQTFGWMNFH